MKKSIQQIFQESIKVKEDALAANLDSMTTMVDAVCDTLKSGGKVIFFGNGGSAADSQHLAAELIGRFQEERQALAAIALTTDTSILTAIGNDYGFDEIFVRQIQGLGQANDIAIGISTSGNSANVIKGIEQAKSMGIKTVSLTGCGGGALAGLTDIKLVVDSNVTARVQETHICMGHAICELVEKKFLKG